MKVDYKFSPGVFSMVFHPVDGEHIDSTLKVTMGNKKCTTYLPDDLNVQTLHPDVLGLVTLLIVYPYIKSEIIVPLAVSQAFHDEVKTVSGINILPINAKLKPRQAPAHSIPALAYSGGVDSTACLMILPPDTCSVFHDRTFTKSDMHNKDAAYHACLSLKKSGRKVYLIKSDFDDVRNPKGFAVEMSTTIPALLLADYIGFNSVALGTTLEYLIDPFQYYRKRTYGIHWEHLFRVVDIQLNQPTAGISEVGTYSMVLNSPYGLFAESCTNGTVGKPCMNCFKCYRKQLTKLTLRKQPISNELLDRLFRIRGARAKLEKFPVFFENVITYMTANYHGDHPLMILLKRKTRGHITDVKWMEKWYSPNLTMVPPSYRIEIKTNIKKYLEVMTAEEKLRVLRWERDFKHDLNLPIIRKYHSEFVHAIRKHQ